MESKPPIAPPVRPADLPDFEEPPLVEVALSVQFDRLPNVGGPHFGTYWQKRRGDFPRMLEQPPVDPVWERFGVPNGRVPLPRLEVHQGAAPVRVWLANEAEEELIQLQADRFVHNWRKANTGDLYPRYETIREKFEAELEAFRSFLEDEKCGSLVPNQCELTYVNIIPCDGCDQPHRTLDKVLTVFRAPEENDKAGQFEECELGLRFVLLGDDGRPVGRLHVSAIPVRRVADRTAAWRLTLTARGAPAAQTREGIRPFLDKGREAIVRRFTSITTPEMHGRWRRKS